MSFPDRRLTGPAAVLVLIVLAASCAGVFQQSFEAFGRHPKPTRWWFAFPEEIHVLDRSTRLDAPADTLVFFIMPPRGDFAPWPEVADVAAGAGKFRIRYLMLSPKHEFLGEQVIVMEGTNRPRVAFGIPHDLEKVELRATLERELPSGEIIPGRILRGGFKRTRSD